jgi:hypothetical protein
LFLAEARTWEVTSVYEGDDVDDDLMLVEDSVNYYGDDRGEVGFAAYFDEDYNQATCLEYGAVDMLVGSLKAEDSEDLRAAWHNVAMALLH